MSTANRDDIARLVWAFVAHADIDDAPETVIDRFVTNDYPGGLEAIAAELDLADTRPELIELLAWTGRERWASHQKRVAASAVIAAGCPLRVAAEAAGVTHQTIANWAAIAN